MEDDELVWRDGVGFGARVLGAAIDDVAEAALVDGADEKITLLVAKLNLAMGPVLKAALWASRRRRYPSRAGLEEKHSFQDNCVPKFNLGTRKKRGQRRLHESEKPPPSLSFAETVAIR